MNKEKILMRLRLEKSEGRFVAQKRPSPPSEMAQRAADLGAKLIPLTQGKFAMIDASDYAKISKMIWRYKTYAVTQIRAKLVRMHNLILTPTNGMEIDHINGNPLDNRKCNLRICDRSENVANRRKPKHNTSGFKGVTFNKKEQKYKAVIRWRRKSYWLGYFDTPELGFEAYKKAALRLHASFANLG